MTATGRKEKSGKTARNGTGPRAVDNRQRRRRRDRRRRDRAQSRRFILVSLLAIFLGGAAILVAAALIVLAFVVWTVWQTPTVSRQTSLVLAAAAESALPACLRAWLLDRDVDYLVGAALRPHHRGGCGRGSRRCG